MSATALIPESTSIPDSAEAEAPQPLRAVHTANFPGLVRRLGASLLMTTYQAGKLVMVRDEGDHLNTHFRGSRAPMGLAFGGGRLAVGTTFQIWEPTPAVASSEAEAWEKSVAALPPEKQVEAVARRLTELNPGFDARLTPTIVKGQVTALRFHTHAVKDLSPLRALPRLEGLGCGGTVATPGKVADLTPSVSCG
jgi:hypothetical protein